MEFPLLTEKQTTYPEDAKCPMCDTEFNGNFIVYTAGALIDTQHDVAVEGNQKLEGFSTLICHYDDIGATSDLIDFVQGGQGDIYVCNTSCLRELFNQWIKDLEDQMDVSVAKPV